MTEQMANNYYENTPPLKKRNIPIFRARSRAKRFRNELIELEKENFSLKQMLDRMGALSYFEISNMIENQKRQYKTNLDHIEKQRKELDSLKESIIFVRDTKELQSVSLFDYEHIAESSIQLSEKLKAVRAEIKNMIRNKTAVSAATSFKFNDSDAKGKRFVGQMSKLLLSAYNSEAENCIKSVRNNKTQQALDRLYKIKNDVEKNGSMIDLKISNLYHELRKEEIKLASKHLKALENEKEKERERKEQLREEKRVQQEIQAKLDKFIKEQKHLENVSREAKENPNSNNSPEFVEEVERKLEEINKAIEENDFRKTNIRAGYVYVISNIGSFGENIVKIGLTRRLEPEDRIKELSGTSVPFKFDTHALFFSEDAVTLETELHRSFADRKVNLINNRREFFYCTPQEVLEELKKKNYLNGVLEFRLDVDAEEYYASKEIRKQNNISIV